MGTLISGGRGAKEKIVTQTVAAETTGVHEASHLGIPSAQATEPGGRGGQGRRIQRVRETHKESVARQYKGTLASTLASTDHPGNKLAQLAQ